MKPTLTLIIGFAIDMLWYKLFGFEIAVIWGLACVANSSYWGNK